MDEGPQGVSPFGEGAALCIQQQEGPALRSARFSLKATGLVLRGLQGSDLPLTRA